MQSYVVQTPIAQKERWSLWVCDTIAVTIYFTLVGGLNEYFVAGLSIEQVIQTRVAAIPILVATGAVFACWRDAVHRLMKFQTRGQFGKAWIDTFACLGFRVPVYALILLAGGAEGSFFWRGLLGGAFVILLSGRPCGLLVDMFRCLSGLRPRPFSPAFSVLN